MTRNVLLRLMFLLKMTSSKYTAVDVSAATIGIHASQRKSTIPGLVSKLFGTDRDVIA